MAGLLVGRRGARLALYDALLIVGAMVLSTFAMRPRVGLWVFRIVVEHWTGATTIALTLHLVMFYVFELYNLTLDFRKTINLLRVVAAVATAGALVALASFVFPLWGFSRAQLVLHGAFLTAFAVVSRWSLTRERLPPLRALLVTVGDVPEDVVEEFFKNPESRFHMVGSVPVEDARVGRATPARSSIPPAVGTVSDAEDALERVDARHLIVAGIDRLPRKAATDLLRVKDHGVEVHDLVDLYQDLSARLPLGLVDDRYFLREPSFTRDTRPILSNFLRLLDITGALGLLLFSWPLWLLAMVGIKLTMPGPVFYAQERVGKDERPYMVYKFRSMGMDAEKDGPRWSQGPVDPRVTPFGRFLRRSRIDELPQLWNVLRGDMSLVGPRPERPVFVAELKREIPYYGLRFQLKPGVTGWAQVNYRYGASVEDTRVKLSYDLFYVQHRSVLLYVLTLVKTVTTVLFKPGS